MYKLLFASILLFSCSFGHNKNNNTFSTEHIQLKHTVRNAEVYAMQPMPMFRVDSLLIVASPKLQCNDMCRVFSTSNYREIGRFGNSGKGPLEFGYIYPMVYNSSDSSIFQGYDLTTRDIMNFNISKSQNAISAQITSKTKVLPKIYDSVNQYQLTNQRLCYLNDNRYMGLCIATKDDFFALLDSNMINIARFGTSPIPSNIVNGMDRLQGFLVSSYGIAIYAPFELPYIGCYGLKYGAPIKLWNDYFSPPKYKIDASAIRMSQSESKGPTLDVAISKDRVYVLWHNGSMYDYYLSAQNGNSYAGGNTIFVYNHTGQRIVEYTTDINLNSIEVNENSSVIYGLTQPTKDKPEFMIVTFDI